MDNQNTKKSGLFKMIGALIVILLAGFFYWKTREDSSNSSPKESIDTNSTKTVPTTMPNNHMMNSSGMGPGMMDNRKYKDGVYSVTGNYTAPSGAENISVSLVLKDDVVASASVVANSANRTAKRFQDLFVSGFNSYVIGKSIDSINLTVVNGSSLTPGGFMDALSKIKTEAKG